MASLTGMLLIAASLSSIGGVSRAQTMAALLTTNHLDCGTVQGSTDRGGQDMHGNLSMFGAEICRAVAVAVLGGADKLTIHVFPAEPEALDALRAGTISVVVGISPSATTAAHLGVAFGPPVFFDTQRIMVSKRSGITTLAGLRDQLICALDMTAPERTLRDEMTARSIPYALMAHSEQGEMDAAAAVRKCVATTGMETQLAQSRANFSESNSDFVFLDDRLSLNPLVPAYRYGDQKFGLIVDWTINALLEAEALGITQASIQEDLRREDMRSEQLLGHDFATAQALGLPHDWAVKLIAATGNYGEIFQRTIGVPYHLERGVNALWTKGGLMSPLAMQ